MVDIDRALRVISDALAVAKHHRRIGQPNQAIAQLGEALDYSIGLNIHFLTGGDELKILRAAMTARIVDQLEELANTGCAAAVDGGKIPTSTTMEAAD